MSRYKEGEKRNQISMEPLCVDEMISGDNAERAIEMIVESMKIRELGFKYGETKETGRKPYSREDI